MPLGFTLDHIGPLARTARDCALMLQVIAGHHASDPTSLDHPVDDYVAALTGDVTGVRVGVDRLSEIAGDVADPNLPGALDELIAALEARGAQVVDIALPMYFELVVACTVIMCGEALAYHQTDLQRRWSDYTEAGRRIISSGAFYSAADYVQAQRVRRVGMRRVAELFVDVDLVLTPTMSDTAPTFERLDAMLLGDAPQGFRAAHTPYWDVVGNPVISIPIGLGSDGLPLGAQLAGRPFDESLVLRAADAVQRGTSWHEARPPM